MRVASEMTKREYLAAKMMAALVSTLVEDQEHPLDLEQQSKSFAIAAVAYADALIVELNKPSLPSEVELEAGVPEEYAVSLAAEPDYLAQHNQPVDIDEELSIR